MLRDGQVTFLGIVLMLEGWDDASFKSEWLALTMNMSCDQEEIKLHALDSS